MQRSWNKHLSHPKEADLFAENATLTFVPTAAGATGKQEISNYLAKCTKLDALQFVVSIADTLGNKGPITLQPGGTVLKSRTVAEGTIVEELLVRLSHDEEIAWLLPGVRPTSKELCFPMVVVATFVKDKISSKRLYWDQATVLKQAGLLPTDRDYAATKNAMIVPALNAAEISTRFMDESNNDNVNVLEKIIASLPAAGEHVPPATGVHLAHSPDNHLIKDSVGDMLTGAAKPEVHRSSMKLSSDHLGGKSHVFDDTPLPKPNVHVDPRRYETHFAIGDESKLQDKSSLAAQTTVLAESEDMRLGKHRPHTKSGNESHFSLSAEKNVEDASKEPQRKSAQKYHNTSSFDIAADENSVQKENIVAKKSFGGKNQSQWDFGESNDAQVSKNSSIPSTKGSTEAVNMWASSSNGLGTTQNRPSSRVLNVPGGKSSITIG